jgi:hypothetical protein
VGFAVDKAALGKVSLRVLHVSSVLHTHSFTLHRWCILATDIVVKHPDTTIKNKLKKLQYFPRNEKLRFLAFLCNEPTNAQLINDLLYCSILHCPYMFRRYCVIFRELVVSTC